MNEPLKQPENNHQTKPTAKPKLLDLAQQKLRYRHMSYRTEQTYTGWIKRYMLFHQKRHPKDMGKTEVERYLTYSKRTQ